MPAIPVAGIAAVAVLISLQARFSCAVLPRPLQGRELPWRVHEYHVQAFILNNIPAYEVSENLRVGLKSLADQLCEELESGSWGFRHNVRHRAQAMTFSVIVMRPVLLVPGSQQTEWTTPGWLPYSEPEEQASFSHGFTTWPIPGGNCVHQQTDYLTFRGKPSAYRIGRPCPEGGAVAVPKVESQLGTVSVLVLFKPIYGKLSELLEIQRKQADLIGRLRGPDSVLRTCAPPEEVAKLPVNLTKLARCIALRTYVKGLAVVPKQARSTSGAVVTQAYGFASPLGGLVEEEFTIRVRSPAQPNMGVIEFVVIALPERPS